MANISKDSYNVSQRDVLISFTASKRHLLSLKSRLKIYVYEQLYCSSSFEIRETIGCQSNRVARLKKGNRPKHGWLSRQLNNRQFKAMHSCKAKNRRNDSFLPYEMVKIQIPSQKFKRGDLFIKIFSLQYSKLSIGDKPSAFHLKGGGSWVS